MKLHLWILACVCTFLLGLWVRGIGLEERIKADTARHVASGIVWAVETGMLIVNTNHPAAIGETFDAGSETRSDQ